MATPVDTGTIHRGIMDKKEKPLPVPCTTSAACATDVGVQARSGDPLILPWWEDFPLGHKIAAIVGVPRGHHVVPESLQSKKNRHSETFARPARFPYLLFF